MAGTAGRVAAGRKFQAVAFVSGVNIVSTGDWVDECATMGRSRLGQSLDLRVIASTGREQTAKEIRNLSGMDAKTSVSEKFGARHGF
jgi:hypothetical protein